MCKYFKSDHDDARVLLADVPSRHGGGPYTGQQYQKQQGQESVVAQAEVLQCGNDQHYGDGADGAGPQGK